MDGRLMNTIVDIQAFDSLSIATVKWLNRKRLTEQAAISEEESFQASFICANIAI